MTDVVAGKPEDTIGASTYVHVDLLSRPESVTLVRSMLAGLGEFLQLDPELQDDLKTAISEACNNVVLHAYEGEVGPMRVALEVHDGMLDVLVADDGVGIRRVSPAENRMGVGLAVISALAERAEFQSSPGAGTEVRMSFGTRRGDEFRGLAVAGDGIRGPGAIAPELPGGELSVRLSPVELLPQLLGRTVRGVAAAAHFPVDRFAALHQLTGAISERAADRSDPADIAFVLSSSARRVELTVAPLPAGSGDALFGEPAIPVELEPLFERLTAVTIAGHERLEVVLVEPRH